MYLICKALWHVLDLCKLSVYETIIGITALRIRCQSRQMCSTERTGQPGCFLLLWPSLPQGVSPLSLDRNRTPWMLLTSDWSGMEEKLLRRQLPFREPKSSSLETLRCGDFPEAEY